VAPIVDQIRCGQVFVALTNELGSALAANAQFVLPLLVERETTVATKTYTNTLALLWLLARLWGGEALSSALETLDQAAGKLEELLEQAEAITTCWMEAFQDVETIIFAGHGPHAATARQAAQTLAEWVKAPTLGLSAGALRHGFVEIMRPGIGVVLFGASGRTQAVTVHLAEELHSFGARVLVVENGRTIGCEPESPPSAPLDEFLSPLLDAIPAQLFTEALARRRGVQPGFRYLQKVVDKL
jgi:fructoselysine-6-P-deglycase FrlB-like protein